MMSTCIFCNQANLEIIDRKNGFIAVRDQYPVTIGHLLIIPEHHKETFFDLSSEEKTAAFEFIDKLKLKLESEDESITGFNIGMNCGADAGQTVFHCHIHLIPRRKGDADTPRGGVRGVIPSKQAY